MAKKVAVLAELAKAAGLEAKKGEAAADFVVRVAAVVGKLPDEDFDKLSDEAADYHNKVAEAVNSNSVIPLPPGEAPVEEAVAETEPVKVKAKAKSKSKSKPKEKAVKKEATKAKVKAKVKVAVKAKTNGAERQPRTDSVAHKMRVVVVKKPNIEFEDAAKQAGVKAEVGGHAWNVFNHAKAVMEIAKG